MTVREFVTVLGFKLDDAPVKKYDKQLDATKEKTNKLATATKGIGMAWKIAAAAAAIGMGWISKNILEQTGQMEQYRNQIQKFTGDADSAAAVLEKLRDTTADPLFGTGNLVDAYKNLRNLGMEADSASGFINVLGDIADGSTENFNALSSVLTKVSVSGKVNEGTIRQLTNAGFSMQDMAEALGKSTAQLDADIAAGRIGFNELTLAMSNATKEGGRFYQNMERQAKTLTGSIKILKSTVSGIGEAIGTRVLPKIIDTIRYITDLIKLGKDGFVNFGAKAFEALIGAIQDVIIFFQILQMRMKKFGGAFTPLKALFGDVFGFLKSVIESAYPFLMNLAQLILVAFKPIQAFVKPILESLKPIIKNVFGFLSKIIGGLIPVVNGLTPLFERLGKIVGSLVGPVLGLMLGIKAVNTAIAAYKSIMMGAKIASFLFSGDLLKIRAGLMGLTGSAGVAKSLSTAFGLLTGKLSIMKAAADGNRLALFLLNVQLLKAKIQAIATAAALKIKAVASIIAAKAQAILNAIMSANPIGLIILGIMALIAAVILLIKNWDKVKVFFVKLWEGIKNIFLKAFDWLKDLFFKFHPVGIIIKNWSKIADFFKGLWEGIKNVAGKAWDGIKNVAGKAWEGIKGGAEKAGGFLKKNWKTIAIGMINPWAGGLKALYDHNEKFRNLVDKSWGKIKKVAYAVWDKMPDGVKSKFIKINYIINNAINSIKRFFSGLWSALKQGPAATFEYLKNAFFDLVNNIKNIIKSIGSSVWDGIKTSAISVVEGVKAVWQGITGFFSGLWEAIKKGPAETFEYIKNAFIGLFDSIKNKFLGFINVIKDGWDKVKGFFGGVVEGVVNFATGGGKETQTKPVNDLIVTPEGQYSTHPDDYIFAMKNPGDLIDALMRFLGGGQQMQPAYAGAAGSLAGDTLSRAAANHTNYNNSNTSNYSSVTAPITVNVNASGMSPEAASAAVKRGVQDALNDAIHSSRGAIQSPEARRG